MPKSDCPTPTCDPASDLSAEDRSSSLQPSAPRDQFGAPLQSKCFRQTPRQATSAVAHVAPEPEEDDPLLAFTPYIHTAPRRNSITPPLQRRFVSTLAATGIVTQAARSIGKSMEALYKLRARPGAEGFAAAWDAALERGVQRLEDCALERAIRGTATPIVSHGEILGWWDKPDNALLRFLLQHRLREKYGTTLRDSDVRPGHPLYDRIAREVEEERGRLARDPQQMERIRGSIQRKFEAACRRFADGWNARIADYMRDNPGVIPKLDHDGTMGPAEEGEQQEGR